MAAREVRYLQAQLASIDAAVRTLAGQAPDLHSLAYERGSSGIMSKVSGGGGHSGVEHHGDEDARELFRRLERVVEQTASQTRALDLAVSRFLAGGRRRGPSGDGIAAELEHRGEQVGNTTPRNPVRLSKTQ